MSTIVVSGATSLIGDFLLPRLAADGHSVVAISRKEQASGITGVSWLQADYDRQDLVFNQPYILVHLAPIWTLPPLLKRLKYAPSRIIAFSSTSRFTKAESKLSTERETARQLISGELNTQSWAEAKDIGWTIFRPTMIYGGGRDQNVSSIAAALKRFGFFPLVGDADGLRMPVHADDLAVAVVAALNSEKTLNQAYNLSGGSTLSYRDMVKAISRGLGGGRPVIAVPESTASLMLRIARKVPRFSHLNPAMLDRMSADLVFSADKAKQDFDFTAREFIPERSDLLKH